MNLGLIFSVLEPALEIWEHKLKTKYQRKFLSLKKDYYEQDNKEQPDHSVLDNIEFELELLVIAFGTEVKRSKAQDSSK